VRRFVKAAWEYGITRDDYREAWYRQVDGSADLPSA
jgi:hypothetical protein